MLVWQKTVEHWANAFLIAKMILVVKLLAYRASRMIILIVRARLVNAPSAISSEMHGQWQTSRDKLVTVVSQVWHVTVTPIDLKKCDKVVTVTPLLRKNVTNQWLWQASDTELWQTSDIDFTCVTVTRCGAWLARMWYISDRDRLVIHSVWYTDCRVRKVSHIMVEYYHGWK